MLLTLWFPVHSYAFVCFYYQGIQGPVGPQVFNIIATNVLV